MKLVFSKNCPSGKHENCLTIFGCLFTIYQPKCSLNAPKKWPKTPILAICDLVPRCFLILVPEKAHTSSYKKKRHNVAQIKNALAECWV